MPCLALPCCCCRLPLLSSPTQPCPSYPLCRLLTPTIRAWAKANDLAYKSDSLHIMLHDHVQTLKKGGEAAARELVGQDEYAFTR